MQRRLRFNFTRWPRAAVAFALAAFAVTAGAADLTVSAAASLTNAFKALGPVFEAQNPGTAVVFNFGASDALLAQIDRGAPVDVFACADADTMDRAAARQRLVAGSRRDFTGNALVLIVPAASALGLATAHDVRRADVKRVAIGNPASVPAGRYARSALVASGLWPAIEPKAIQAQSVRQALDYVARGEVEAGFVYATDAAVMRDKVKVVATIATVAPITYPVAAVAGRRNAEAALRFVDFLLTPAAQDLFQRHGFAARP